MVTVTLIRITLCILNENLELKKKKGLKSSLLYYFHWMGAYRTNALYSGPIFVRLNGLEDVFT